VDSLLVAGFITTLSEGTVTSARELNVRNEGNRYEKRRVLSSLYQR
jgi:hypothetical protein